MKLKYYTKINITKEEITKKFPGNYTSIIDDLVKNENYETGIDILLHLNTLLLNEIINHQYLYTKQEEKYILSVKEYVKQSVNNIRGHKETVTNIKTPKENTTKQNTTSLNFEKMNYGVIGFVLGAIITFLICVIYLS